MRSSRGGASYLSLCSDAVLSRSLPVRAPPRADADEDGEEKKVQSPPQFQRTSSMQAKHIQPAQPVGGWGSNPLANPLAAFAKIGDFAKDAADKIGDAAKDAANKVGRVANVLLLLTAVLCCAPHFPHSALQVGDVAKDVGSKVGDVARNLGSVAVGGFGAEVTHTGPAKGRFAEMRNEAVLQPLHFAVWGGHIDAAKVLPPAVPCCAPHSEHTRR